MTNTNKRILVIGATGMLGKPVAQRLKTDGFDVRVLARSPEKARAILGEDFEFVRGDYEDRASLMAAMRQCDGVHITIKGGPTAADFERADHLGVRRIAEAARDARVGRVTLISAYALSEAKADTPESRAKLKGEAALKASGVPYTLFRCSWFMETLPLFAQGKSVSLIGKQIHPLHWVAAADYARSVANSYKSEAALNKELYIFGPEAYTMGEALEQYAAHAGLSVSRISTRMLALLGTLTFNTEWKSMATLMMHYERWGEDGSPDEANRLLGAPQITLREWLAQNHS